jgi:hypothetical protein
MTTRPDFGFEPSLDEMLDDPVVQAVMARDGVDRAAIVGLAAEIHTRLVAANENSAQFFEQWGGSY